MALITAIFAGATAVAVVGPAPAAAAEGGTPTVIQFGDSFASGEGGGWAGNSSGVNPNAGNRQGTDLAARQRPNGSWDYAPEQHVYDPATYRELNGWWGANACHRSVSAPITWVKDGGQNFAKVLNLACSGAKSKNVWLPANGGVEQHKGLGTQLEQLRARLSTSDDVKLVVIGVGGNDVQVGDKAGFGSIVASCVSAYVKTYLSQGVYDPRWCKDSFESKVGDAISDVFYNTLKTVDQVRQVLTEKGQALGTYKLVVTGYPTITPSEWSDWSASTETGQWAWRCPVRRFDSSWINRHLVTRLNDMIQAAAQEKSAAFIDLRDAFDGHRLCESGTSRGTTASQQAEKAEWVRYFDIDTGKNALQIAYWFEFHGDSDEKLSQDFNSQRSIAESFHPNYWGQRALGHCLQEYYVKTGPLNSLHRCHVAGVGPYDHPDYMTVPTKAPLYAATDDPTPNLPIGSYTTRQIVIPASVTAGHYVQWLPDITHARKGQLRIHLTAPNGTTFVLRDFNPNDTGGWGNGTFTRNYTADPSGTWTLKIWESDLQTYNGKLNKWSLRLA